jgi:hypothetical protein
MGGAKEAGIIAPSQKRYPSALLNFFAAEDNIDRCRQSSVDMAVVSVTFFFRGPMAFDSLDR